MINPKQYQLSNHLGNVLEVVSNRKLQVETTEGSGVLDYYVADVVNQSDYFPFGMLMPNTDPLESEVYRYLFNGKEVDPEIYVKKIFTIMDLESITLELPSF